MWAAPSGLADSLNIPSLLGVAGAAGLVPHNGVAGVAGAPVDAVGAVEPAKAPTR